MDCLIPSISEECFYNISGIKEVRFAYWNENLLLDRLGNYYVLAPTLTYVEHCFDDLATSFTQNLIQTPNGHYYETSLDMSYLGLKQEINAALLDLAELRLIAIVTDNNDRIWLIGAERGLRMTKRTDTTGAYRQNGKNGYDVTFIGSSSYGAVELDILPPPQPTITVTNACDGTVTSAQLGVNEVNIGDIFTITFTAGAGSVIQSILVDGVESIGLVTWTDIYVSGSLDVTAIDGNIDVVINSCLGCLVKVIKTSPNPLKNYVDVNGTTIVDTVESFVFTCGDPFTVNFNIESSIVTEDDLYSFSNIYVNGSPTSPTTQVDECGYIISGTIDLFVTSGLIVEVEFVPVPKLYDIDLSDPDCYTLDTSLGTTTVQTLRDKVTGATVTQPTKALQAKYISGYAYFDGIGQQYVKSTFFSLVSNPTPKQTVFYKYQADPYGQAGAANLDYFRLNVQGAYSTSPYNMMFLSRSGGAAVQRLSFYTVSSGGCLNALDADYFSFPSWYQDKIVASQDVRRVMITHSSGSILLSSSVNCCDPVYGTDIAIYGNPYAGLTVPAKTRMYRVVAWGEMAEFQKDAMRTVIY